MTNARGGEKQVGSWLARDKREQIIISAKAIAVEAGRPAWTTTFANMLKTCCPPWLHVMANRSRRLLAAPARAS